MTQRKPYTICYVQCGQHKEAIVYAHSYDHASKIASGRFTHAHMWHIK